MITLFQWQKERRLSDRQAAKRLGLGRGTYSRYINGEMRMPLYVRLAVSADIFHLPPIPEDVGE